MTKHILYFLVSIATLFFGGVTGLAQSNSLKGSKSLGSTETFVYDVRFKWGIVRGKVGQATLSNKPITTSSQYFSQVKFRTTGVGNVVFPTTDTLETLYSSAGLPLRYERRGKERKTYLHEEIVFSHHLSTVDAKINSAWGNYTMADTIHTVSNRGVYVLDLVSTVALVRMIDYASVSKGTKFNISIPLGKSVVFGDARFERFDKAKMPNGQMVDAIVMILNIRDKAFDTSKNSVEVFLSKDDKLLPLLVRAKLKLGYAECTLTDYSSSDK